MVLVVGDSFGSRMCQVHHYWEGCMNERGLIDYNKNGAELVKLNGMEIHSESIDINVAESFQRLIGVN